MDHAFWHQKWARMEIGFHQEEVNPILKEYWSDLPVGSHVLVPLCGKSKDMLWLLENAHQVTGVELSEIAVKAFFEENKLLYTVKKEAQFLCYQAQYQPIKIYCGDFFKFTAAPFTAIYDRAALVALPKDMRLLYVQHCKQLSDQTTRMLLLTLQYDASKLQGPPFSVSDRDVSTYWSGRLEKLQSREIIDSETRFKQKGLESLVETVWQWK
jgi:thiopurine S-methyltransferase